MPEFALASQGTAAAVLGFLSHVLYFIRGRQHSRQAVEISLVYLAALGLLFGSSAYHGGILYGMRRTALLAICYLAPLFSSMIIYRLVFHRTRHFPGPLPARVSKIYSGPWLNRKKKLPYEHLKLAEKYGDFVRVAPNQIMIRSVDGLTKIHGAQSKCLRSFQYENETYHGKPGLASMIDREQHRGRRKIWEQGFSSRALESHEVSIRATAHDWLVKLEQLSKEGSRVNTTLFSSLLIFDTMGRVGFSKSFGLVAKGEPNRWFTLLAWIFETIATIGVSFSWPLTILRALKLDPREDQLESLTQLLLDERMARPDNPEDILKHFIRDYRAENPKSFFDRDSLHVETSAVMIGATDTASCALSFLFYFLAQDRRLRERLRQELAAIVQKSGEFAHVDLQNMELLDALVNETLRVYPPASSMGGRITPPEGLTIDGVWIPGGTEVDTPVIIYHRSEKYFKDADQFIPERWTTRPELILDKRAFVPFMVGPMSCVGRRLGLMELRMFVAYSVWNYDFDFAPGEDGSGIERELKDHIIMRAGPLQLKFKKLR